MFKIVVDQPKEINKICIKGVSQNIKQITNKTK